MDEVKAGLKICKNKVEEFLNSIFVTKVPALPERIKNGIAEYGPYIALIVLIISVFSLIPLLLGVFTIAAFSSAAGNPWGTYQVFLSMFFYIPMLVLEVIALPGLMKRSKSKGWDLLFYAFLLALIYDVLTLNIPTTLLQLFFFYFLFQIRSNYK